MPTRTSLLHLKYHLMSFDLYAEYSISPVKTQFYFKDQPVHRCQMQKMRRINYFFKIFHCNLHYNKRLLPKFMNASV